MSDPNAITINGPGAEIEKGAGSLFANFINWLGNKGKNDIAGAEVIGGVGKGLVGLGGIYTSLQAINQAKKDMKFNQAATRVNLANQAMLVNQQIADRYAGRNRGETQADIDAYMANNSVKGTI